jgi:DNA processing protein
MGYDPVTVDALMALVTLTADQLIARLTELELDGVIATMPGGKVQRLREPNRRTNLNLQA